MIVQTALAKTSDLLICPSDKRTPHLRAYNFCCLLFLSFLNYFIVLIAQSKKNKEIQTTMTAYHSHAWLYYLCNNIFQNVKSKYNLLVIFGHFASLYRPLQTVLRICIIYHINKKKPEIPEVNQGIHLLTWQISFIYTCIYLMQMLFKGNVDKTDQFAISDTRV